jgi:hypothetical protein
MFDNNIHFMLFEKSNILAITTLISHLKKNSRLNPVYVKGFDYKEYSGVIKPYSFRSDIQSDSLENYGDFYESKRRDVPDPFIHQFQKLYKKQPALKAALLSEVAERSYLPGIIAEYHKNKYAMKRYCDIKKPRLVVLPEDTDYIRGRMACYILRQHDCKVVIMVADYYNILLKYPLLGHRSADLYLTSTSIMRQRLITAGVASDRIKFCGSPRIDESRGISRDPVKNVMLFVLQNLPKEALILKEFMQTFDQFFPGLQLWVKPHPETQLSPSVRSLLEQHSGLHLIDKNESIIAILERVQAVIGQSSTVLYQAIAAHVPVMIPNLTGLPIDIALPDAIATQSVIQNRSDIVKLTGSILNNQYILDPVDWLVPERASLPTISSLMELMALGKQPVL